MVARVIKAGLQQQPRLLGTRATAGSPLWNPPQRPEQLANNQQAAITTAASYANAARGRSNPQQRRAPARGTERRMESAEYTAHREKVSAAVAEVAVQKHADGTVTAYDPRKARELFTSKENRLPPRVPQVPRDSLIVSGLPADFEYADAREMMRQVVPRTKVEVVHLPFVQEGLERYMLLKLPSTDEATTAMTALNKVTLTTASRPLRARYAKRTVLGREEYKASKAAREAELAEGETVLAETAQGQAEKGEVHTPWSLEEYTNRHQCLLATLARAEQSAITFIYLKWVAKLAEEMFAGEGDRVAKAFMANAGHTKYDDRLAKQLIQPAYTAGKIREARDAVLQRTHLQRQVKNMPLVVREAFLLTDESKRDQMLAKHLFPAVAELVQDHKTAGDITRFLIRRGERPMMEMCADLGRFSATVKTVETATEKDEGLRAAMLGEQRSQGRDGVDFSPLSSPISLLEQWYATWDTDTDPNKVKSLNWKREAITYLVELNAPSGTSNEQKKKMVDVLTADKNKDNQEWFSGMLVHPENAFKLATAAILEGSNWNTVSEYLQGGLGGGASGPPFSGTLIQTKSPDTQRNQPENGAQDSGDVVVLTSSNDHSDEDTTVVPDTPPTDLEGPETDRAWVAANEEARVTAPPQQTGEKHGRQSSPTSSDLFPAKRMDADEQNKSIPDSQPHDQQRATTTTQRTAASGQEPVTAGKKGFLTNNSGKAPASHGASKPSTRAASTSGNTPQGKAN